MIVAIRLATGRVSQTLICDCCRKRIHQRELAAATVDFSPLSSQQLARATEEQLDGARARHFHGECTPKHCTGTSWQKGHRVMLGMVRDLFDEPRDPIAAAVRVQEREIGPGLEVIFP